VLPAGERRSPAFHFVNGAHPERRSEPIVQRVTHGLARAGFVVALPDLPGLGDGELTPRTFDAARLVTQMLLDRPEVREEGVALAGASTGAGIALVTAADPALAGRISVIAAVVPFADVERLTSLATTSHYERDDGVRRYEITALMRRVVARSLVAALPAGDDRDALLDLLRSQDPDDIDGVRCLSEPGRELGPEAQAVVELLLNEDHARFSELYRALPPDITARLRALSPGVHAPGVRARVEGIAPPEDPYFPLPEAEAVVALLPDARLTVTRVLDHTRPSLALSQIGDFARFLGWVRRCLGAAAA
jgi:hypothetical protein